MSTKSACYVTGEYLTVFAFKEIRICICQSTLSRYPEIVNALRGPHTFRVKTEEHLLHNVLVIPYLLKAFAKSREGGIGLVKVSNDLTHDVFCQKIGLGVIGYPERGRQPKSGKILLDRRKIEGVYSRYLSATELYELT